MWLKDWDIGFADGIPKFYSHHHIIFCPPSTKNNKIKLTKIKFKNLKLRRSSNLFSQQWGSFLMHLSSVLEAKRPASSPCLVFLRSQNFCFLSGGTPLRPARQERARGAGGTLLSDRCWLNLRRARAGPICGKWEQLVTTVPHLGHCPLPLRGCGAAPSWKSEKE